MSTSFIFEASTSNKILITSFFPFAAAKCIAIQPSTSSLALTSTPFSINAFTISVYPKYEANIKGVAPPKYQPSIETSIPNFELTSIFSFFKSSITVFKSLLTIALCKDVYPSISEALMLMSGELLSIVETF